MKKIIKITSFVVLGCVAMVIILSHFIQKNDFKSTQYFLNKKANFNLKETVDYNLAEKFQFNGSDELHLDLKFGDIDIDKSPDDYMHFTLNSKIDKSVKPEDLSKYIYRNDKITYLKLDQLFNEESQSINFIKFNKNELIWSDSLKVKILVPAHYKSIILNSVSADFKINQMFLREIKINNVSGDFKINNSNIDELNLKTVSGDINFDDLKFLNINLDSVSGDIVFKYPNHFDLVATLKSVSGNLSGDEYFKKYISGDQMRTGHSSRKIAIHSISGDVSFIRK